MRLDEYLSEFQELRSLYEMVKEEFLRKRLVHHNWNHVLRDLAGAVRLGEDEKADMKIVLASVLLHDIGRLFSQRDKDHHLIGAEVALRYLRDAGFSQPEIEQVRHCIVSHGLRGEEEPKTLEARVCYDVAVFSCAVGNIGVARVFSYFMREEGIGVKQMVEIPGGRKGPRRSFYTGTGRKTGEKGFLKAARFWKQLGEELEKEERNVRELIPEYEGD